MSKVKGLDRMFLSGTVATFTFEKGFKVDEKALSAQLAKSCKSKKLTFNGLSHKQSKRAATAFVAKTPGLT